MSAMLTPASTAELAAAVRSVSRLIPVGGGTKSRLYAAEGTKLSTKSLRGILEYDPSEFTFTALAGTPVFEMDQVLREKGQYLPFDPMCAAAGATLGGTVAAGLSGPGRLRYGGVRDFILGTRFVDGNGRLLRMGARVVKNAAGFDLPKFFVGTMGRLGVLAEITFKVFPRPPARLTLKLPVTSATEAAGILSDAVRTRWELDALDLLPGGKSICARLAGPATAIEAISKEVLARWPGQCLPAQEAEALWSELGEFLWADPRGPLIKSELNPAQIAGLHTALDSIEGARAHISAAGNVAYISLTDSSNAATLDAALRKMGLRAVTLRGEGPLQLGSRADTAIARAVKLALDPQQRFPPLDYQ